MAARPALLLSIQELACNDSSAFNLFATLAIVGFVANIIIEQEKHN